MPPDLYPLLFPDLPDPLPYPGWEPYHTISASAYYVPFIGLVTLLLALYGLAARLVKDVAVAAAGAGDHGSWPWGRNWLSTASAFPAVPMPYRLIEAACWRA